MVSHGFDGWIDDLLSDEEQYFNPNIISIVLWLFNQKKSLHSIFLV